MKMYEVNVSPDDETIHLQRATAEQFRVLLAEHAPLPWEIRGQCIYDANGNVILQGPSGETGFRVLGAVLTGVATCGGFGLEN